MFNIVQYKKPNHEKLFENISSTYDMTHIQNYIPIYSTIFLLNENNFNKITLNTNETLLTLSSTSELNTENIHVKFAPIMDPFRFVMGKYSQYTDELFCLPTFVKQNDNTPTSNPFCKINNPVNSSYVDGFFYYLSTKLIEKYNFLNGVKGYGSFVGIKNNFKFKINDDLDYLITNNYFLKNSNKLFQVDDYSSIFSDDEDDCSTKHTNKKNKINISNHSLLDNTFDDILDISEYKQQPSLEEPVLCQVISNEILIDENILDFDESIDDVLDFNDNEDDHSNRNSSDEDCDESEGESDNGDGDADECASNDNNECVGDDDEDGEDVWVTDSEGDVEDDDEEEEEDDEEDEKDIYVTLDKFPVTFIAMEKCNDTLDNLIENDYFETDEMWYAMLLQIIMSLIVYQKAFTFTHNDLHTNNVMFVETDMEYIEYIHNKIKYRVPTFGKIYKIIDFGRSIYKVNDVLLCSDSYDVKGDAHSQYNFEPFFNSKNKRVIPNPSFDLCRLATSMLDFLIENPTKNPDVCCLIEEWCQDDNGKNVLYKKNGDERYPEFKLYKMIARNVNRHTPENQLNRKCFTSFISTSKENTKSTIDIDRIPPFFTTPIV
jgi:hypothetical protein